jgi:SnoaL-like domain
VGDDLVDRYYEAYNSGNEELVAKLLDETVTLTSAAGTQKGRDAYLATYRYMASMFVDQMTPRSIRQHRDSYVVDITNVLTARHRIADFVGVELAV